MHGITSSLLGLLRISWTRSLSAFTSSSSFSSCGTSGIFQVLAFVKHFLRGRKQDNAVLGIQLRSAHCFDAESDPCLTNPGVTHFCSTSEKPQKSRKSCQRLQLCRLYAELFVGVWDLEPCNGKGSSPVFI